MFTIVGDLLVLGAIGYCAVLGYSRGMRPAVVVALELFFSLALALLLAESVAAILAPVLASVGGRDFDAETWSLLVAFATVFSITVAVLQTAVPRGLVYPVEDDDSFADDTPLTQPQQIGGAILGAASGVLLVGVALILLSMLPLPVDYRFRSTAMLYDVGAFCLRGFSHVAGWGPGGRSVLVYGEPVSTAQEPMAKLSSEGYTDMDGDRRCSETDAHYDIDESGTYSADLYYLDLDEDRARRIGLLEKYVTAQWGVNPTVMNRERPGAQPAAPPPDSGDEAGNPPPPPATPPPPAAEFGQPEPAATEPPPPPAGDDF